MTSSSCIPNKSTQVNHTTVLFLCLIAEDNWDFLGAIILWRENIHLSKQTSIVCMLNTAAYWQTPAHSFTGFLLISQRLSANYHSHFEYKIMLFLAFSNSQAQLEAQDNWLQQTLVNHSVWFTWISGWVSRFKHRWTDRQIRMDIPERKQIINWRRCMVIDGWIDGLMNE